MRIDSKYTQGFPRAFIEQVQHRLLGLSRPILRRQPAGDGSVALTFDDGPSPETTPHVLAALARAGARATFFLSGVRVAAHPDLAAAIVAAGHAVYGHGWEHVDLERAGPEAALAAARRAEAVLSALRPTPDPYLMRFPYNAGHRRGWMHRAMTPFHPDIRFASWSFSTRDWLLAEDCADLDAVAAKCAAKADEISRLDDLAGSVVLLHENPFGAAGALSASVARIFVPMVIERIQARGLAMDAMRAEPARRETARVETAWKAA